MKQEDPKVGVLRDVQSQVFQCASTGLLYVWGPPSKRYVSVTQVELKTDTCSRKGDCKRRRS